MRALHLARQEQGAGQRHLGAGDQEGHVAELLGEGDRGLSGGDRIRHPAAQSLPGAEAAEHLEHERRLGPGPVERARLLEGLADRRRGVPVEDHLRRAARHQQVHRLLRPLRRGGEALDLRQGGVEVEQPLARRVAPERLLGGTLVVERRPRGVAGALEVGGELAGDLDRAPAPRPLEPFGDAAMGRHPPRGRHAAEQRLAVERVHEDVAAGDRAVGPARVALPVHQVGAPHGHLRGALGVGDVDLERGGQRCGREARPDDRRRLEGVAHGARQRLDALLE